MSSILFSVIIPLYNKEEHIFKTIQHVLSQSVTSFELIIVDDGSTDGGPAVVESIQDPRVRMIHQENAGVAAARNCGIREAKGEYICFLDADDIWERDFLETAENLFRTFSQAEMVCPSYQVSYGNRIVHPIWRSVNIEKDSYVEDFYEMATAPFWICNSSCVAIKRDLLMKLEHWFPEGETVYEDFDLWIRLGSICRVAHSNRICATYQRGTSDNARKNHTTKVVYSATYMETLNRLQADPTLSDQQYQWLGEIRDRRMVPYIFSLLLRNERSRAREELRRWRPCANYTKYKIGLNICSIIPYAILKAVQTIRLKLF